MPTDEQIAWQLNRMDEGATREDAIRTLLGAEYEDLIGYNPFEEENATITIDEVAAILTDYKADREALTCRHCGEELPKGVTLPGQPDCPACGRNN